MDDKEPQNCWDFFKCSEEELKKCPAFIHKMGHECWLIASTFENPGCCGKKGESKRICIRNCSWFKKLNPNFNK